MNFFSDVISTDKNESATKTNETTNDVFTDDNNKVTKPVVEGIKL